MSTPNSSLLWSVPQSLTDAQKLQARQNAGAVGAKSTTTSLPPTSTDISTLQFFTDGRVRGDNTDIGCLTPNVSQSDSGKVLVASWSGSPGVGKAQWQAMPDATPWGTNTNTHVTFTNQPDEADPPVTEPAIDVTGILNYKNNIVNIAVPSHDDYVFCNNSLLRINPPTIQSASDAFGFNFWVRLAITAASSSSITKTQFQVVMPYVGWEIDQYWLEETAITHTFSAKRLKIADNPNSGYSQSYPKILEVQQVGPGATPTASDFNKFAPKIDVVVDYSEKYTANTSEASFNNSMDVYTDVLHNDFGSNTSYTLVDCPSYGYTNYYMIHVTGDMAKLKKFVPYVNV